MRLGIIVNSKAGSGKAASIAARLTDDLKRSGHAPRPIDSSSSGLASELAGVDGAIVVGGDGSVHHALPALLASGTPLYHAPTGTENLFARQFKMSVRPQSVLSFLALPPRPIDIGECNDRPFAIMLSVGPDAGVMRRMALQRKGPITHLSYAMPVIAESLSPSFGPMSVQVDGHPFVQAQSGLLVVASVRQYALRIDPAPHANPDDAQLDVVFFPAWTTLGACLGLLAARCRVHIRFGLARGTRGSRIEIQAPGLPVQIDGEACDFDATNLRINVRPAALRVFAHPA